MLAPPLSITNPAGGPPIRFDVGTGFEQLRRLSTGLTEAVIGSGRMNPVGIRGVLEDAFKAGVRAGYIQRIRALPTGQRPSAEAPVPVVAMGAVVVAPGRPARTVHQVAAAMHRSIHTRRAALDPGGHIAAVVFAVFKTGVAAGAAAP